MKYICFGYLDVNMWSKLSASEQTKMMDDCLAYDEVLQKNGHWAGGEALQGAESATSLRYQNGKVNITDGPYAETKELLGGLLFLEAKDLNQAIQLLSNHPGMKMGPWEIRPTADLSAIVAESKKRRGVKA